jgi:hypothetical protein
MRPIRLVEWFQRLTDWVTGKKKQLEVVAKEPVVKKGRGRPKSTKKNK